VERFQVKSLERLAVNSGLRKPVLRATQVEQRDEYSSHEKWWLEVGDVALFSQKQERRVGGCGCVPP
jgi:hypothetical protein